MVTLTLSIVTLVGLLWVVDYLVGLKFKDDPREGHTKTVRLPDGEIVRVVWRKGRYIHQDG